MARDIAEIRRDIEDTRERLRETAEAIGWKADVPSRARDAVRETAAIVRERMASGNRSPGTGGGAGPSLGERVKSATSAVTGGVGAAASSVGDGARSAKDALSSGAGSASEAVARAEGSLKEHLPASSDAQAGGRRAVAVARSNPMALALGALALGAAAGAMLPSTRVEDERLGPVADDIREKGAELGERAVERGREVAGAATSAASGEGSG